MPLLVAAALFWRLLRRDLDEMLQRIVLEGLAFALVVYIPLAALYVNLRTAGVWTLRLDPPDLLMAPALLVAIGIALERGKYDPSLPLAFKIAKLFGCRIEDVFDPL